MRVLSTLVVATLVLTLAPDLAWAAEEGRVLLAHDVSTMTAFASERVQRS